MFPAPVGLVKLQLNRRLRVHYPPTSELVFRDGGGSVPKSLVESMRYAGTRLTRIPRVVGSRGRVLATLQAAIRLALADRSGRRWRSLGSDDANWLAFSAGATPGTPLYYTPVGGLLLVDRDGTSG
jgi:hypothetical protein